MGKEGIWFNEGIAHALTTVEEDGIEALRKEVKFRGHTGISLNIKKSQIDEAKMQITNYIAKLATAITISSLEDTFCFSHYQIEQFIEEFANRFELCDKDEDALAAYLKKAEEYKIYIGKE